MNRANSTSKPSDPLDRISGLPVSIICHILSFLPTKDAVATHILSKSWSFLWTSITNLDFSYKSRKDLKFSDFVTFVNYVMLYHKSDAGYLNKLSLTLSEGDAWINAWICSAFAKNVRELFVSCKSYKPLTHVQTCMFTSQWLQSLDLEGDIRISSEILVSLPRLERLKLISSHFNDGEDFRKLVDGCPLLKYLYLDVSLSFSKCIDISSTSLRHLEVYVRHTHPITTGPFVQAMARRTSYSIKLDAPSLEYIKLQLERTRCITFVQASFTSLEEAIFDPHLLPLPSVFDTAVKAIQAFDCAKVLTLSAKAMEALSSATIKLSTKFMRLTRLEATLDLEHWSLLQDLITLSDNLQVLTIKKGYQKRADDLTSSNWKTPNAVPRCLSNSLETISIGAYYGHVDELAMVAYTLEHGSVLQRMHICFDVSITDFKTKYEMLQLISKFPRKSLCEVEFS